MTKYPMRELWACPPEPRTHGRVEVKGTDEDTSQRYLALATLQVPQNLPSYDLELAEILPPHDLDAAAYGPRAGGVPVSGGASSPYARSTM